MQRANTVTQGVPHQACASCKHQRKKCDNNCILAPYFPAERTREFQAIHKVFGVSNVQKIIKSLDEKDRHRAVDSLVWEAYCRQKDPILGPYGEYSKIYDELKVYKNSHWPQQQSTTTMQVLGQGGLVYKTPPNFVGWNCNNGINNKGILGTNEVMINNTISSSSNNNNVLNYSISANYNNNNNNMSNNSSVYSFPSRQDGSDIGFLVPMQQNATNGLNSAYYLSGEYSPINSKTMDSTIWENGP